MKKKVKIYESDIKRSVRRGLMENLFEQHEMGDTYSRAKYRQSPKEKEIEGVFGQYGEEIPPSVLRYMRKNPKAIIDRLYDVYGQQMFEYINNKFPSNSEVEIEDEEIVVDESNVVRVEDPKDIAAARASLKDGDTLVVGDSSKNESIELTEDDDWMQDVSDEIEKDGTEGTFREYCLRKGYRSGCSRGCIEEALRSRSTKLHYRAGLAHAFCSAKR